MTDPAREYIQLPDGSAASRPGPQTLWKVVKGANGAPWRLPPACCTRARRPNARRRNSAASRTAFTGIGPRSPAMTAPQPPLDVRRLAAVGSLSGGRRRRTRQGLVLWLLVAGCLILIACALP